MSIQHLLLQVELLCYNSPVQLINARNAKSFVAMSSNVQRNNIQFSLKCNNANLVLMQLVHSAGLITIPTLLGIQLG